MSAKYGVPYFSNYINSDMEPSDVRSMCPLTADTMVTVKDQDGRICDMQISEIYDNSINEGVEYKVWTNSGWCYGKPVRMPMTKVYKITTDNGCIVKMGENHLQPIIGSIPTPESPVITYADAEAKDLLVGCTFPFIDGDLIARDGSFYDYDNLKEYNMHKITEKCEVECDDEYLYCFEVANDDHVFMLANGLMTHNCRLRLDLRELRKKSGGFFGSGESTGSIGVVTINIPKIAYQSATEEEFFERLNYMMDISAKSLKVKRNTVIQLLDAGLYPYTKRYLGTFDNHFSTIGLVGMNEACLNACWIQKDLTHESAQHFTVKVLNHMRERLSDYQEQYGDLYNLEATPAESTTYRFAKHDKQLFPNIITANEDGEPYYTNSSHLPVGYTDDVFEALDIQDQFQTLYTSGTVFHTFLGERMEDWKIAAHLVKTIAENYKLPYYTLSPTYSVCKDHGYINGEYDTCPDCGGPTEVYSRITGYYRAVQNWNDGKSQEFKDRKEYNVDDLDVVAAEEIDVISEIHEKAEKISEYKIYDYEMYVSNEIRKSANPTTLPAIHAFERQIVAEYQPVQTPINIKNVSEAVAHFAENSTTTSDTVFHISRILITTETCPNCNIAKVFLDKAGVNYNVVLEDDPTIVDTINELHINSAPTLIVNVTTFGNDNVCLIKYTGVSEIRKYIESLN